MDLEKLNKLMELIEEKDSIIFDNKFGSFKLTKLVEEEH